MMGLSLCGGICLCLPITASARESLIRRSQRLRDLERVCLRERRQTVEVVDWELPAQSGSCESAKTMIECLKCSGGSSFVAVMKTADLRQFVYTPRLSGGASGNVASYFVRFVIKSTRAPRKVKTDLRALCRRNLDLIERDDEEAGSPKSGSVPHTSKFGPDSRILEPVEADKPLANT
jgi:hypothetical protein